MVCKRYFAVEPYIPGTHNLLELGIKHPLLSCKQWAVSKNASKNEGAAGGLIFFLKKISIDSLIK